jgi:hypothetical protein
MTIMSPMKRPRSGNLIHSVVALRRKRWSMLSSVQEGPLNLPLRCRVELSEKRDLVGDE